VKLLKRRPADPSTKARRSRRNGVGVRRPEAHRPPARSPAKERRIGPKTRLRPRLINRPPQASPAFPQSCPQRRPQPHSRPQPGGQPHNPSSPSSNHTRRPTPKQDRVSETAYPHRPVIPRRSTHHPTKRPESRSTADALCQRQDGTVSCQRFPHQSTGLHRLLSPAVDKARTRTPQMWIKPGEIDVDKHEASRSCPPPVDGCGFPVEGSGDDGPVASQRCPHLGGQTPWISGG
jgi:hypothetical protein